MSRSDDFVLPPRLESYSAEEARVRANDFYQSIKKRRSIRHFSDQCYDREILESCILAAGTAPNGANQQPWHFAIVQSADVKRRIRIAAEKEEREFYDGRASSEWLDALAPLGH